VHDVENLLRIFQTQSFSIDLRLSAAQQLAVVVMDNRFWPLLGSATLNTTLLQQIDICAAIIFARDASRTSNISVINHTSSSTGKSSSTTISLPGSVIDVTAMATTCMRLLYVIIVYQLRTQHTINDKNKLIDICLPCRIDDSSP
jgi:hypothetical protein